jgi:hypothetical protein
MAEATALRAELAQLRAENARLRRLLGFEDRTRIGEGPSAAWSPSLFPDRAEPVSKWVEIDRGSPREAKLALFPVVVRGARRCARIAVGERANRQGGMESGRAGWVAQRPPPRLRAPAAH